MPQKDLEHRINQIRDKMASGEISADYELRLEQHYRQWLKEGDTVLDVGAHIGRHLAPFLDCVGSTGQVLAFEPLPYAFKILKEKFTDTRAVLHNVALGTVAGLADFTHAQGTPEESGLQQRIYNAPERANPIRILVNVKTLDSYSENLATVDFIKIDTEGGEIGCLQGGQKTLARFRPLISVEYGYPGYSVYGHTKDTLFDFATQHGYQLFDIFLHDLAQRDDWNLACDGICWDFFMVPKERVAEFRKKLGDAVV
jgi:FkbM family methyltransferase